MGQLYILLVRSCWYVRNKIKSVMIFAIVPGKLLKLKNNLYWYSLLLSQYSSLIVSSLTKQRLLNQNSYLLKSKQIPYTLQFLDLIASRKYSIQKLNQLYKCETFGFVILLCSYKLPFYFTIKKMFSSLLHKICKDYFTLQLVSYILSIQFPHF